MATNNTALLVIDVQHGIVEMMGFGTAYVQRVGQAIEAARGAGIPVIYARIAYRAGAPEVHANNRMMYNFAKSGAMQQDAPSSQIHPLIAPKPEDLVVSRTRASAFSGSELEIILRSLQIEHLVLAGNATRMGVQATLFSAADRDYRLSVLGDCCADFDPAVHELLISKVFPQQAEVLSLEEWRKQLG